jgi:hypothetical protein
VLEEISEKLSLVKSTGSFQLLFYGSKFRGEDTNNSDYNFYLIANPTDQLQSSFTSQISDCLEIIDTHSTVGLIAGDFDSLKYRLSIFEPTAIHLVEYSQIVYGKGYLEKLQSLWVEVKKNKIDRSKLKSYLQNRAKFYKNLRSKNTKEDISRIEKVISLNIQLWILNHIPDISTTEICFMDIPSRLISLIRKLYFNDADEDVNKLIDIYEQIHELKQNIRLNTPYTNETLSRIKESVNSIQNLHNLIMSQE